MLGDVLEMVVALCRCGLGRVTRHGRRAWRHNGVRCFIARVLKQAGYDVPDEDLEPRFSKRDYSTIGN